MRKGIVIALWGTIILFIAAGIAQIIAGYETQTTLIAERQLKGVDTRAGKKSTATGSFFLIMGSYSASSGEYEYYHYYEKTVRGYRRRKLSPEETQIFIQEENRTDGIVEYWKVEDIPNPVIGSYPIFGAKNELETYTILRIPNGSIKINEFNVD